MELRRFKKVPSALCVVVALVVITLSTFSYAETQQTITLNDLIENGKAYDGKKVMVSGEALLEPLEREDGTWININDGTNAMGLWMSKEDAKLIKRFGDYHGKGDILKVEAVFNRACQAHGGDMELHVTRVIHVESGYEFEHQVQPSDALTLIALSAVMATLAFLYWKRNVH